MNTVPDSFIRVMPGALHSFVREAFLKAEVEEGLARLLADTLVAGDLRGVFSHGTQQTAAYVSLFRQGKLNPRPRVAVVRESATSVKVDGDGGLGYEPSFKAVELAVDKARTHGVAVAATSNHGHFGSAGHYTRVAVEAGFVGLAASSHLREFRPEASILSASGASPISIGVPAGDQPPLILDMAAGGAGRDQHFAEMPGNYFKLLGFGLLSHALGGIVAGMVSQEEAGPRQWEGVNQGAFFVVIDVAQLTDTATFRRQMDDFICGLRQMQPAPGHDRADAPGGLEHERERTWSRDGIPVGDQHQEILGKLAADLGIPMPW